ncbi:MAG: radical SAM protein [Syntrophobacterales bacterium]|nr:radical SAM protein [Syntrophobacterales bacterium]
MTKKEGSLKAILLIYPPLAKASEPPGGPARLVGALGRSGISCRVWDANIEGQTALLKATASEESISDKSLILKGLAGKDENIGAVNFFPDAGKKGDKNKVWLRRAARHVTENIDFLRSAGGYLNSDRYRRAVLDLNCLLAAAGRPFGVRMTLADYQDERLSPVRSADLLHAAKEPQRNPFYEWFSNRLPLILGERDFSYAGFSLNYLSQALTTFSMIGFLRREYPQIRIVVGGGLITSWMRRPDWNNPFAGLIDEMVAGPGEVPLLSMLGGATAGNFSLPAFDDFPLADYFAPGFVLPYSASGGCWWQRCTFCPEVAEGNPYLPFSPQRVVADIAALVEKTKPRLIHMLDNALAPALLDAFIAKALGAPWYGFARVDARLADADFCRSLRNSGCVMLKLGIESGDPFVLEALRKGIDLPTVAAALRNLKEVGIAAYVYLLFGTPAENVAAARRTLSFVDEHAHEIAFLNLALFNLPAYSPEAALYASGEFYEGDLSLYRPFVHPEGWNRREVRRFLEGEFKRRPAVAKILRRDPPFFTSNHAPFCLMRGSKDLPKD